MQYLRTSLFSIDIVVIFHVFFMNLDIVRYFVFWDCILLVYTIWSLALLVAPFWLAIGLQCTIWRQLIDICICRAHLCQKTEDTAWAHSIKVPAWWPFYLFLFLMVNVCICAATSIWFTAENPLNSRDIIAIFRWLLVFVLCRLEKKLNKFKCNIFHVLWPLLILTMGLGRGVFSILFWIHCTLNFTLPGKRDSLPKSVL